MASTPPCLFSFRCGSPRSGSREHILFASLGGLRVSRDLLCHACQPVLGDINKPLAQDINGIAARIGASSAHRGPIAAVVVDPDTKEEYRLTEGTKISYLTPRKRVTDNPDGTTHTAVVCSTQKQRDDFIRTIKGEGRKYTVTEEGRRPMRFSRSLQFLTHFGGESSFRPLAHLALNFLGHAYPTEARHQALDPFKRFILDGGSDHPVTFDYSWRAAFGENAYRFGHRVVVGRRSDGELVAGVSLYGIYDVSVRFGSVAPAPPSLTVFDIDPLTKDAREGWDVRHSDECPFAPSSTEIEAACRAASEHVRTFVKHVDDHFWERDAPDVVRRVNEVRLLSERERPSALAGVLDDQLQRILNGVSTLARAYAKRTETLGPAAAAARAFFDMVVEEADHDLSPRSEAVLFMIRDDVVEQLLAVLAHREIAPDQLRAYLEGRELQAAVNRAFVDILDWVFEAADDGHSSPPSSSVE